jgi:predicted enzyme related to lactoylglutathione lyase
MNVTTKGLVPLAHVNRLSSSIEFYARLGFSVGNTFVPPDGTEPTWACLVSGDASIMLAQAEEPVIASQQGVLFYLYVEDVAATHAELAGAGIVTGSIAYPFYAPRGEFRIEDPDGYVLMVTHT